MDALPNELQERLNASPLLGYLNFSDGRPDVRFQRALADSFAILSDGGDPAPWLTLPRWLAQELERLHQSGTAAFRDVTQARAIVAIALGRLPAAYRDHHRDLLAHQSDALLFSPFFLARACEAVLAQGAPWNDEPRILVGAINKLNDFVGHRPIALLETRAQTEYYPHEKCRPIPLFIRGAGALPGRYQPIIDATLIALSQVGADILHEACFELNHMDELALDPRAYDHHHPANRRPNYLFGEWDPHHIDAAGRYRRFIVRQVTLDALCDWLGNPTPERLTEAGIVLAGTILMASGISGSGPTMFDSGISLTMLVPRIARYRDRYYLEAIARIKGEHGARLQAEADKLRQPFAAVRQHLNQALAKQRAFHLQERQLAILFAEMGYPEASRYRARQIPVASVRVLSEIHLRQTACQLALDRQDETLPQVPVLLKEIEDLLHRGIDCGALADPWNILGFQGLFPIFNAREDSTRDPRVEEMLAIMSRQFSLYALALSSAAIAGDAPRADGLRRGMEDLAAWWDRFATSEVSDIPLRVHGEERTQAARHVAGALADWRNRPENDGNDLSFWREHHDGFRTPAAYAQVIEALIRSRDWRAAFGLLMTWLGDAEAVPLEETGVSFQKLLVRWFEHVVALPADEFARCNLPLRRVFELLEANADRFWQVPDLHAPSVPHAEEGEDSTDRFGAAYEGMSYQDSTDDGEEGSVMGDGPPPGREFPFETTYEQLLQRLGFLTTVAKLWQIATRAVVGQTSTEEKSVASNWSQNAQRMQQRLLGFLDELADLKIPEPIGEFDAIVEYDRRRAIKESVIDSAITASVEIGMAVRTLAALQLDSEPTTPVTMDGWERHAVHLELAILQRRPDSVRAGLTRWLNPFSKEPLLLVPLSSGGHPRQLLRARVAMAMLQSMLERLPSLGLLRETYHLIRLARRMERNPVGEGQRISEFDRLFRIGLQSIVETLLSGAQHWVRELGKADEEAVARGNLTSSKALTDILWRVADSMMRLWLEHSDTLQLSILEAVDRDTEWERLRAFVQAYGNDLFTVQFLALGNMRGILHRGTQAYLEGLLEHGEPSEWPRLVEEIAAGQIDRDRASRNLEVVMRTLLDHYKEYSDYNATTAHSDYGENLHQLLDFLRLKVRYERFAWRMRPMLLAHEVLCRRGYELTADRWRAEIAGGDTGQAAQQLLQQLGELEAKYGIRLRTVRDRLEERFVQPLMLDRMCAMVEPAMRAAGTAETEPFRRLEEQLQPLIAEVIGGGLESPNWLRRFTAEVRRVRDAADEVPNATIVPAPPLTFSELERQLTEWEKPIVG